jgi:CubicO group peptidase (beta-lactamase class C family)
MTKPLAAYAAMQLVEAGELDLDVPLAEYLDTPYLPEAPQHALITTRMALNHTTGFPNWRKEGRHSGNPLDVAFQPGSRYGYFGEGFQYLQHVMEHVTGRPLDALVQERLLGPAGMAASAMAWQERYAEIAAAGHDAEGRVKTADPRFRRPNAAFTLFCSACDYARFLVEMMREDRAAEHSLGADSIRTMLTRSAAAEEGIFRGLGWAIAPTACGDRVFHGGANGTGFRCWSEFYPHNGNGVVIMTNSLSGDRLHTALMATLRGCLAPAHPPAG